MKKFVVLLSVLSLTLISPIFSDAEEKPKLSQECLEKMKYRDQMRDMLIMEDVISSFNLDIDESGYDELTYRDLDASHLIYGGKENDSYYKSLRKIFETVPGWTQGHPKLYIKPLSAYFLYKKKDNTNVMVLLKLNDEKWEVVEKKETKGKEVKYKRVKCEKEYLKKRNEYEIKK
ncbi:hypothetical protein IIE26_27450 (plasmid) [Cytobacillus oceanisediminis]|uniref:hypothetical protein n=1 Tax=Cytobacillus oceanisediminis TaxID=665099 RepID=UPI0018650C35|nr:hypothetical protein [Cytobacillus oceanisediminis]QOK30103.1 hypothetical protein IIE26_27450 [Cytobacillus oceanisediminis]